MEQMQNDVQIIGLLKTLNLEEKQTRKGRDAIMGDAVVEVTDKFKHVNNIRVNIFAFQLTKSGSQSKLYTAFETVMNEYKTIDDDGRSEADYVRITGSLDSNIYSSHGAIHYSNRIRAVFFSRLKKEEVKEQKSLCTIGVYVQKFDEAIDADGNPLGYSNITAFSVGYNGTVIPIFNLTISGKVEKQFRSYYVPGSTGIMTFRMNNYAKPKEKDEDVEEHGFGSSEEVGTPQVDYVNNKEVTGGHLPFEDDKALTPDEGANLIKQFHEMINQAKENASDGFENNTGFESKKSDDKVKKDTSDALDVMFGKDDNKEESKQNAQTPTDDDAPKKDPNSASEDSDEFKSFMSQI